MAEHSTGLLSSKGQPRHGHQRGLGLAKPWPWADHAWPGERACLIPRMRYQQAQEARWASLEGLPRREAVNEDSPPPGDPLSRPWSTCSSWVQPPVMGSPFLLAHGGSGRAPAELGGALLI